MLAPQHGPRDAKLTARAKLRPAADQIGCALVLLALLADRGCHRFVPESDHFAPITTRTERPYAQTDEAPRLVCQIKRLD